jgi:hypothetical protein
MFDELAGALEPSGEILHVLHVGRKLLRRHWSIGTSLTAAGAPR